MLIFPLLKSQHNNNRLMSFNVTVIYSLEHFPPNFYLASVIINGGSGLPTNPFPPRLIKVKLLNCRNQFTSNPSQNFLFTATYQADSHAVIRKTSIQVRYSI